jgi:hypothetical protein
MIRYDLQAAGIPYRDTSGRVLDFHSLRCETATLLDAAGMTPRVVQRIMGHSTLELTGRYRPPRAVALEAAASMLPTLRPTETGSEQVVMTGTDPRPVLLPIATADDPSAVACESNQNGDNDLRLSGRRSSSFCQAFPNPNGGFFQIQRRQNKQAR